ncbi:MAG: hypothetical protein BGP24_10090 [Lysobacterales bacterium 69-70]|nr:MAG: hypothetical protein ABS97_13110 [Xanthomonadaceae bacterium SCN 69-320]OJZ00836.1 MAG: hypothetical protein BGP24_10090 [Xanthomonadales bacterium 69-70]
MVREIQQALVFSEAKPEDKTVILDEAEGLLTADPILLADEFAGLRPRLLGLFKDKIKALTKGSTEERMLRYTLQELAPLLQTHYVLRAFDALDRLLLPPAEPPAPVPAPDYPHIHAVTAALLSTLLDRDFSLESLFRIYAEILVPRHVPGAYHFDRKLGLTRQILTGPSHQYDVTFALDLITRPEELPAALGNLEIADTPPFNLQAGHAKTSYLTAQPKRRFATVRGISAADRRAAGLYAYERVANIVNLLRFEYEQARLHIPDHFAVLDVARPTGGHVYPLPRVVPNPATSLNGVDAAQFVASVNELLAGAHFTDEGRDRITSAFRLYRQGRDQDTIETKLVHWWTALEYLVRGSQASGSIGKSIENSVSPVIGLSYVPKLLLALRTVLLDHGVGLNDSQAVPIDVRRCSMATLWEAIEDPLQRAAVVNGLAAEPFLQVQVHELLTDLGSPAALLDRLKKHDKRVRWHLQRIWRTRCDIVHSAGRGANHLLLCSNLEYYLKTTLHGLLGSLRSVPTLSGPHEYFDREAFRYDGLLAALGSNDKARIRSSFPADAR